MSNNQNSFSCTGCEGHVLNSDSDKFQLAGSLFCGKGCAQDWAIEKIQEEFELLNSQANPMKDPMNHPMGNTSIIDSPEINKALGLPKDTRLDRVKANPVCAELE